MDSILIAQPREIIKEVTVTEYVQVSPRFYYIASKDIPGKSDWDQPFINFYASYVIAAHMDYGSNFKAHIGIRIADDQGGTTTLREFSDGTKITCTVPASGYMCTITNGTTGKVRVALIAVGSKAG